MNALVSTCVFGLPTRKEENFNSTQGKGDSRLPGSFLFCVEPQWILIFHLRGARTAVEEWFVILSSGAGISLWMLETHTCPGMFSTFSSRILAAVRFHLDHQVLTRLHSFPDDACLLHLFWAWNIALLCLYVIKLVLGRIVHDVV